MGRSRNHQILKYGDGTEMAMIRGDILTNQMVFEKPSGRWDPEYWHPKYDDILTQLRRFELRPLSDFIRKMTCGYRGKTEYVTKGGVQSIEAVSILSSGTGIDPLLSRRVKVGGDSDTPSRRTKMGDLLFARSGVGTAGRSALTSETSVNMVVGGHILKITLTDEIEPQYIQTYLKTSLGWEMLDRVRTGVAALVLDEDDVRNLQIPILPESVRGNIRSKFRKMSAYHDDAIDAKKKDNEMEYRKKIQIAKRTLKDLVARTEAVIRGEREDVI